MKPVELTGQDDNKVLVNPDRIVLVKADRVPAVIRPVADGVDELVSPSYIGSTILLDVVDRHSQNVTVSVKQPPASVRDLLYHARKVR